MTRVLTITVLAGLLWLCMSCRKQTEESSEYLELRNSSWGIGITLGMNREQIVAVLDEPNYEVESRNKLSTDLIWIPSTTDAHGLSDSQLRLTMTDDKLSAIKNIRKPSEVRDVMPVDPPFMVKPAVGCAIGAFKSDFVKGLGNPATERSDTLIWDHESLEGERLRITAVFDMDVNLGTAVCNSIAIQTGKRLGGSMAEEKKEKPVI